MKYIMRIKSLNTNTYLNVYGNDTISNSRNVTLWELDENAKSQKWQLDTKNGKYIISSLIDTNYNLDFYRGSSSFGNCTVYKHGNDISDAEISTFREQNDFSKYWIRNIKEGKYLTVEESGNGRSNVVWREEMHDNDHRQEWKLEFIEEIPDEPPVTGGDSKELNMPACHNQRYEGYSVFFNHYCCSSCSVAHVAEFYSQRAFDNDTLERKLVEAGVIVNGNEDILNSPNISDVDYRARWCNCPYGNIGSEQNITDYSSFYKMIKEEIDNDRPVILKQIDGDYGNHYVVAYKYVNGAKTQDDIYVLDSANLSHEDGKIKHRPNPEPGKPYEIKSSTCPIGRRLTMKKSLTDNYCEKYGFYMKTFI